MYVFYILPRNSPVNIHVLPYCCSQVCGRCGGFWCIIPTHEFPSKGWQESIVTSISWSGTRNPIHVLRKSWVIVTQTLPFYGLIAFTCGSYSSWKPNRTKPMAVFKVTSCLAISATSTPVAVLAVLTANSNTSTHLVTELANLYEDLTPNTEQIDLYTDQNMQGGCSLAFVWAPSELLRRPWRHLIVSLACVII